MSKKSVVTGQFNLVNETNSTNVLSFDLATLFGTLTGILEHNNVERQITLSDGVVTLDKGGVGTMRGFLIAIKNGVGPITLKHDSNTAGIVINSALIFFGEIDAVTIQTASTQAVSVEYLFFE